MEKYVGTVKRMLHNVLPRRLLAGRVLLCGLLLIVLCGTIVTGITVAMSRPTIQKIILSPDSVTIYSAERLTEATGLAIGGPMYAKTKREISDAILASFPDIQTVKTSKTAKTGVITLEIEEKQPYFYIVSGSDVYLADSTFTLLRIAGENETVGLVRLAVPDDAFTAPGLPLQFGDDTAYYSAFITDVLHGAMRDDVTGISLEKRYDLKILIQDRIVLCWGTSEKTSEKTALCQTMLQDAMFGGGAFVTVDVSDPAKAIARPLASGDLVWTAFSGS